MTGLTVVPTEGNKETLKVGIELCVGFLGNAIMQGSQHLLTGFVVTQHSDIQQIDCLSSITTEASSEQEFGLLKFSLNFQCYETHQCALVIHSLF